MVFRQEVLLEKHSEHLILRFLRRIRETGKNEATDNHWVKFICDRICHNPML